MRAASELCYDCGLCCDGTLFSSVALDAQGIATAREHRLPLLETVDALKFELPCPALRGVLCGIYEERPETCADFSCEVLVAVDEGDLSFEDARAIIDRTRSLSLRIRAVIGDTPWWSARRSALAAQRSGGAHTIEQTERLMELNALEELVRDNFWG